MIDDSKLNNQPEETSSEEISSFEKPSYDDSQEGSFPSQDSSIGEVSDKDQFTSQTPLSSKELPSRSSIEPPSQPTVQPPAQPQVPKPDFTPTAAIRQLAEPVRPGQTSTASEEEAPMSHRGAFNVSKQYSEYHPQPTSIPPGQVSSYSSHYSPQKQPSLDKQQPAPVVVLAKPSFWQKNGGALAKLGIFFLIIFIFGSATTATATKMYTDQLYRAAKGVLYSAPLKTTVWQSFGSVPEAELMLPIETPKGRVNQDFLLDTGAVVSSLPREMAEEMGYDLAFLPRQTFKGFGNTTSFAYKAEMDVYFDNKKVTLPVVFTQTQGSKPLLGRKGLFDKFTIIVDHKSQLVEIRE